MKIAFIGHRKINITNTLKYNLYAAIEKILYDFPDTEFLFGSNSEFDFLCLQTINNLRLRFPYLKRIYVRAKMENLNESYEKYLHSIYDNTFFPNEIKNTGKALYVERNKVMIDMCDKLFVYYDPHYTVSTKKGFSSNSGTKIAFKYALKSNKEIINFFIGY